MEEQLDALHDRKKEVRARLLRAMADGKLTAERISVVAGRAPTAVAEWLAGIRYPPSTLLDALEKELKKVGA